MNYKTHSEADTLRFGAQLAGQLRAGDTVLLHGDLGVGKSVLTRGVARALGVAGAMPSPTFTLLIPYEGEKKLYHFDLYRLNDPDEFYEAGLDEFIGGDGIALVEWPEMAELEPDPALEIRMERVEENDEERLIRLRTIGNLLFDESGLAKWRCGE